MGRAVLDGGVSCLGPNFNGGGGGVGGLGGGNQLS